MAISSSLFDNNMPKDSSNNPLFYLLPPLRQKLLECRSPPSEPIWDQKKDSHDIKFAFK